MRILRIRNAHQALPMGLQMLDQIGVPRESRGGNVIFGGSVTTVYEKPLERVVFWPERDANPFFHLYEALWMLAGRDDLAPLLRYVKRFREFSDDGVTLHGAYGHRWRKAFGIDQLAQIARILKANPEDRRCVLQMWDVVRDLGSWGKDLPCNTIATFQRGVNSELNLSVFCRSNDIVWGAYGANAVQFGFLLEYMALWIGCPVGTYEQISVNWHGYEKTLGPLDNLRPDRAGFIADPYQDRATNYVSMGWNRDLAQLDLDIQFILDQADSKFQSCGEMSEKTWVGMVHTVLKAHHLYSQISDRTAACRAGIEHLALWHDPITDWIMAARQWFERRSYNALLAGDLTHP